MLITRIYNPGFMDVMMHGKFSNCVNGMLIKYHIDCSVRFFYMNIILIYNLDKYGGYSVLL